MRFRAVFVSISSTATVNRGVVASICYYRGWIKAAFFESWRPAAGAESPAKPAITVPTLAGAITLAVLALATVLIGFFPQPLTSWLQF